MANSNSIEKNKAFLRNIFEKGPFCGHGFTCDAVKLTTYESSNKVDFTASDKAVTDWVPWVIENYNRSIDLLENVPHDGVPFASLGTGTHIYAAAFGCRVNIFKESNPCALPLVKSAEEADKILIPDIWKSPSLYRIFELAHEVRKKLGVDVYLGPPDMQSGFDTAALIWDKTSFYCALMMEDEQPAAMRLVEKCAMLFKEFLIAFRKEFPNCIPCHCPGVWTPPEMGPWLSNDECGAFNVETFETFCLPELIDLSKTFGGLGMHCCANAEHQFESFKKIPGFYAFNRVAATQGWQTILDSLSGPDAPVHVLGWVPDEEMKKLIRNASKATRFIFNHSTNDEDEAKRWLDTMRSISTQNESKNN